MKNHRSKLKVARRMTGLQVNAFRSPAWQMRKLMRKLKVIRHDHPGRLEAIGL